VQLSFVDFLVVAILCGKCRRAEEDTEAFFLRYLLFHPPTPPPHELSVTLRNFYEHFTSLFGFRLGNARIDFSSSRFLPYAKLEKI
jgi:hypothetical protein